MEFGKHNELKNKINELTNGEYLIDYENLNQ